MTVLAIDPGTVESAFVVWNGGAILDYGKVANERLLNTFSPAVAVKEVVIEMIASYGMPVGREVFETVVWIGRFMQAFDSSGIRVSRLTRLEIKSHLCHSGRANDANIRQAIIDRFGGPSAIGKKACPGPLYGISGDVWSALAVALTFYDRHPSAI